MLAHYFWIVDKLGEDKGAHIVRLDELIQRLVPGGVVQVELLPSHWKLLAISRLIYFAQVS